MKVKRQVAQPVGEIKQNRKAQYTYTDCFVNKEVCVLLFHLTEIGLVLYTIFALTVNLLATISHSVVIQVVLDLTTVHLAIVQNYNTEKKKRLTTDLRT